MKRLAIMRLFAGVLMCFALNSLAATTQEKTVAWALPEGWEQGVTYDVRSDGYVDIYGGELSRRYGLGGVGEPDLLTLTVNVGIPDGGAFVSATLDAVEWAPVEVNGAIPIPIAEPVQYGAELVYPTPEKGAYEGVYPSEFVVAGRPGVSGGVTMVPITVTPYKWDGTTKTLYKAASLKVKITLQVKRTLRLSTSSIGADDPGSPTNPNSASSRAMARTINPDDLESAGGLRLSTSAVGADDPGSPTNSKEIIIVSPSEFVRLWEGYAAFRKNTEAGKDFTYTIVNTADIYKDPKYWTAQCEATKDVARNDNADALAIHHYLEEHYDANKEQYIILGAAPTKVGYDRACMIPARYVINQNSYDQVCDMYYGCMDRKDGTGKVIPLEEAKKMDEPPEVWDYNHDGWYMGSKNAGGGYTSDEDARVDWDMDVPVTRVPLMREYVEYKDGHENKLTAAQIMDHFTNNIAFAESETTWDSSKRWRHVLGGGYLFNSYARGSRDYLVRGERQFFDGGVNHFDASHKSPSPDAEACPRTRNFEHYSYYRAARHGLINTGGLVTCDWGKLYESFGDCFDVHCHGWARGADPGTTGGALFSTGLWRVYNMALPCESGMYDYWCKFGGVNQGYTNCCSMGEAPLLCFNKNAGGLVTFNNSRYGWWGGYNGMSSYMEGLINRAIYQYDMNAGQTCVWMHNNGSKTTYNRGGSCNIEVIMHGDPLIKISPQYDRSLTAETTEWNTNTVDYTKNLYVDVTDNDDDVTFDVTGDDLAAARLKMVGNSGQTITLVGGTNGMFRTTDATVVTNANFTWNVAGGAGRNGIEFVGEGCNLTFEGKANRYVGYKVLNAASVNVTGGNVTFDFDHDEAEGAVFTVGRLAFGGSAFDTSAYNVIRTRKEGFFSPSRTIGIVNNCVELQTWNIGGGTTANKDAPLFFLTNSYLKVTYNPYWETEYFVRPTHLTNARIVGEYEKFGFGRPEGYGYDLYVWGTSYIEGTRPIMLNGELRVHLMNNATLEIANPMSDGHGGMKGSIRVMGAGTLRITGEQTFTGGITVESGTKLEFTIAKAVKCDVTVEKDGELKLATIPLEGVKTITMEGNSKLILPFTTGAGVYQVVDSSTSSLVLKEGALVYDAKDLATPLEGKLSEGYFLLTANLIDWQGTSGTWKNDAEMTENWHDAKGNPIGFTNTMPVVFGRVGVGASVTVDGEVKPGFVNFDNAGCPYTFGGDGSITIESLASSYDVTFGVNLALGNVLKVLGGSFTVTNVESSQIDVSGGALHVTGAITEPTKKVRTIKFEFAKTQDGTSVAAVQELRLFRGDNFVPMLTGTIIEDIAGQKIKITGYKAEDKSHTYEWLANKPGNENESLKALIDGVIGGNNKWWASKNSAPTWFTITFPEPQELVTGYAIEAADANYRNPKTWRVYTSPGTDNLTLAGGQDGYTCDLAKKWMGPDGKESTGNKADFEIQSVDGALVIHNKGTLVADGECRMNLKFEVGATLAVTNTCALSNAVHAATLTLPEEDGSVLIDASKAAVTSTAFPILRGYELTPEQFRKFRCESDTAVISLKDGDLYVVTDGIKKAPYTATVSDWAGTTNWSSLVWTDGNGLSFAWTDAINYRTDGDATINLDWVDGKATTLNLNVGGALGSLTLGGRATDPITLSWGAALVPRTLDFRPYAGPVTLDYGTGSTYALGYADFYAGRDTEIPSASSGTLVIGAGKRAIIPGWGDFAKITGDGTVAIKLAKKGDEISPTWGNEVGGGATTHTNILELLRGTWKIENTDDYPKTKEVIVGAEGVLSFSEKVDTSGYKVCPTGLTVENGGEVHFGKRDTFNRTLTLRNGGKVLMTKDATDTNRALDIYENATIVAEGAAPSWFGGTDAKIDDETGDPIVNSGIIALRRPKDLTVTVRDDAMLRMFSQWGGVAGMTYPWTKNGAGLLEFYRPSEQTGNMTIEAGVVRLVNKGQGTKGAIINNAELQVCASNGYEQTVANVIQGMGGVTKIGPGTTILTGVNTYRGDTTVEDGTLKIGNTEALGASSVWMVGGVLDMGALRIPDYTVNATREAALLAAFKIRAELTTAESYGQVQLVKLGAFAEYLTSGELKQLFTIVVNGVELKPEEFKIVVSGGIAEYQPDQLEGYNYPLETTVATSNDWAAFEWRDQSGVAFTNDWADYPNATVVVNVEPGKNGQMTFAHSVTTPRLTINNKGGYLEIGGGAGTLHPAGMVDATGCGEGSVTFLNFDLGACNIDTGDGEVILLPGCSGTLNTDPGSIVTVTNGTGKGTAVLAAGSELRFLGTKAMNNLLWCSVDNRSGAWIGYGFPITIDEAAFGGVGEATRTDGNFHFQGNLQMVTKRFVAGNGTGTVENFKQTGGAIDVTGNGSGETTTDSTVLLAHWPSTITWEQSGGTFTATNAPTIFGWDGKIDWTMTGGTTRLRGLWAKRQSGHDNTSSFTLAGGRLEIGDLGLIFRDRGNKNASLTLAGGTLSAYTNAIVDVQKGIVVAGNSVISAETNALLTVDATITGEGVLTVEGDGVVRYVGDCSAAKLAGTFEIQITEEQRQGTTSSVLFTLPDGVTVPNVRIVDVNGEPASGGNGAAANGKYHWVPSGTYVQPITTTLNGGEVKSYETKWYDAAGTEIAFKDLTTAMDLVAQVTADTTLTSHDTKTFGKMTFTGGHKLTLKSVVLTSTTVTTAEVLTDVVLADGSFTLSKVTALPAGASLTISAATCVGSFGDGPFTGTFVCNGFDPGSKWTVFQESTRWQGVLKVTANVEMKDKALGVYGNSSSTFDIVGVWSGYLPKAGSTDVNIKLSNTFTLNNGYSTSGGYKFNGALSGVGTIQTSGGQTDVIAFMGDASQFRGTIDVKGGHCVSFGDQADDGSCEGKIAILSTTPIIAADKTWGAQNGIVVQNGGVLSVEFRNGSEWAAGTSVTVNSGGTLNLVRTDDSQREFKVSNTALSLNGTLTLNGVPVPSWGFEQNAGTITLKEKAVCILPVKANVSGRMNLTELTFTDSAEKPNTFTPTELLAVSDLEIDFTMSEGAELVVDNTLGASTFRFLGEKGSVSGSTGSVTIYAGKDTTFDTAGKEGVLVIESGMKATAPSWPANKVLLLPDGWLKLTDGGTIDVGTYGVAGSTLELAGAYVMQADKQVAQDAALIVSGTLSTANMENGIKAGGKMVVAGGTVTLEHRFIASQGSGGTADIVVTDGELASGAEIGHVYVGGWANSTVNMAISGGKVTARYAPYKDGNGVNGCFGNFAVHGSGIFAPTLITRSVDDVLETVVEDVTVTGGNYGHHLDMGDGGTYLAPAISPNWFAINVTNGVAHIGAQDSGATFIKGPIAISAGATLNVTNGTVKLNVTMTGEGTLNVSESATLDLNGHNVYNVTGSGTVTNSSATVANVIYNTTFNTNLTFNCNVKLENPYVDVAEACEEITLITKGAGVIASMDGVRVRVNGKLDRRTWKLAEDRKGIEVSVPYSAFLTKTTNWNNGEGEGLTGHLKFQDNKNYSIVITNSADEATLTFDTNARASVFKLVSDFGNVATIAKTDVSLDFDSYDFSEAHGRTTLAYNPGGLSVTAGTATHLPTGGSGKLTIPSGATAVVGAEFASYANEGTLRRDYDCGERDYGTILKGTTSSVNSFKSVTFTGGMQAAKVVIQVLDGDRVTLKGASGNYGARTQSSFDVCGGTLRIESNSADTWYGMNGTTAFRQSGGVFEVTANNQSQNGNVGFMFGYANTSASYIPFDISGGHFLVENTSINFYDPSIVTLSGTGLMRAKGVFKAKSDATMTIAEGARFELGSLGWRANSAALTMTGGTLATFESAKMENAITLGGDATIGAAADTTLTLNATVSGAHTLTIGTVASNDTGKVVASGSRFACGKLVLAAGTLEIPVTDPLTNDVELTGGNLNLTGLEGAIEYVITTGSLTGATDDNITFNGLSLAEANLKRDGNRLLPTVAVQPFHLDIPSTPTTYTSSWTNAPWLGVNNVAVTPDQWSLVCVANVTVAEGVTAALTVDSPINVEILNISNKGELNVQLAHPDFSILEVNNLDSSEAAVFTVIGQDGVAWPVSKFGFGTNRLDIACGTRMSPFTIDTKEKLLESRDIHIADGAALCLHELSTGSGNSVWTIAGGGWDKSTLILSTERGLGFNAGSNFTNLTLVVDAALEGKTIYLEQRSEREVLTDSTVDLVITNDSKTIVQGSSTFGNTLNIGNLSGDGTISGGSYNNATLGVNLHSDSAFDGVCKIPMLVSGGHTLTLTAVNTGAITVTNNATVKLALDESATHTAALSGDGTVDVASGTLRTAGDLPCKLVVDAAGRIDIVQPLADAFTLSTQGITFGEGASVTNNLTANGEPLAGRWTIEGGTIRRAPAIEPFALAPTFDSDWTSAGWRDADGEDVVAHDCSKTVTNATITVDAGTNATLAIDRDLSLGTLEVQGAGVVAVANPDRFGFSASSIVITNGVTLALPGCTASTINGNGSLVLRATDRDTAVSVSGAFDTTKFTGPICLDCGTWNIKGDYPQWFALSAVGENAVLRFNKQDLTGYNQNFPDLVIADGATLKISKRDTFDRKLVLKNGAKMVLDADDLNSGRAFDFFSRSSLKVEGAVACTIGGITPETTASSGIICLRRNDFEMTVDTAATLDVWAQWGKDECPWKKLGAGKVIFRRASGTSGKLSVNGGTVQLVDGGRGTTGEMALAAGTTLELNASEDGNFALNNRLSGEGGLVKLGPGTFTLAGETDFTGATVVSNGTLVVRSGQLVGDVALFGATVTLDVTGPEGQPEYDITQGAFAPGEGRVLLNGAELSPHYAVDGNKIVAVHQPATVYALPDVTVVSNGMDVLTEKGGVDTVKLGIGDTLVICDAHAEDAQAIRFNQTIFLEEIRFDANGVVKVQNSDLPGEYVFDGAQVSVQSGTLTLFVGNHGDPKVRNTYFTIADGAKLTNWGWPGIYGTVTIDAAGDTTVFDGNNPTLSGDGRLVKKGSGRLTMAAKTNGQSFTIDEGTLTLTRADGSTGAITGTGTLELGPDATVVPSTIADSITLAGTGTFVYDNAWPDATIRTKLQADAWHGTVWIKNALIHDTNKLRECGNAHSKIKVTGVMGYMPSSAGGDQGVAELVLADDPTTGKLAFEIDDSSKTYVYGYAKFSGDGTFKFATKATSTCAVTIADVSAFTGRLLSTAGKHHSGSPATTARPIFVGGTGVASTKSLISVADGMTVYAGCGWEAAEVAFGRTLVVKGAVGDVLVTNVTTEATLDTTVYLKDPSTGANIPGYYKLAYDAENKLVKVVASEGTILTWNGSGWEDAQHQTVEESEITTDHILCATADDIITFASAVTPKSFLMPMSGKVTVNGYHNLGVPDVNIMASATLKVVFPDEVTAITNVFSGAGTLELALAGTDKYVTTLPIADANFSDVFTGDVKFSAGQFKTSTAIKSSVAITVVDGAQLFITGGTWGNAFTISGNGWNAGGRYEKTPIRFQGNTTFGATSSIHVKAEGAYDYTSLCAYSGTITIGAKVTGDCKLNIWNNSSSTEIKFTRPHEGQFADFTGDIEIEKGLVTVGANTGYKAGDTLVFAKHVTVDSTGIFKLHLWSGKDESLTEPGNHVYIATDITLNGGTLYFEDGSYILSSNLTVAANSTMSVMYDKGRIIKSLRGDEDVTLTIVNRTGSYANDGMIAVKGGDFAGTIADSTTGRTFKFVPVGEALANATVKFAGKGLLRPQGDATIGTLDCATQISGSGTLAVNDGRFTSTLQGVSLNILRGMLNFAPTAEMPTNTLTTGSVTVPAGQSLRDVLLFNGETLDGSWQISEDNVTIYRYVYETISVNFAGGGTSAGTSPANYLVTGVNSVGLVAVPGYAWNNVDGTWGSRTTKTLVAGTVNAYNGTTNVVLANVAVSCAANNTYQWADAATVFFKGYLDDGNRANVTVTGLAYERYDVIIYGTADTADNKLSPVTVNGKEYTYVDGGVEEGSSTWGATRASIPAYGQNALRVRNLTGETLTIVGGANANKARGGIAAIQVINTTRAPVDPVYYFATIAGSTNFADIAWTPTPFVENEYNVATLTVDDSSTDEVVLTFDSPNLTLDTFDIVSPRNVWLDSPAHLANVRDLVTTNVAGLVIYGWPTTVLNSGDANVAYGGGAGSAEAPLAIGHNGGALNLRGGTYYLAESTSGTATTVNVTDSTLDYGTSGVGVGMATYNVGGTSSISATKFVLSQGQKDRSAVFNLGGEASVSVSGTTSTDGNASSVMFGHWNGPSTFTLADDATFTAASDVLVGLTGNTQTININGGVFTARGIKASKNAKGTNTLNLNGGELVLGETGITSYGTTTIAVNVTDDAKITATAALSITQPMTVATDAILTLDATVGDITFMPSAGMMPDRVTVLGGNVYYGFTVDINSCGTFKLTEGLTKDNVKLYDVNGNPVAFSYNEQKGALEFAWEIEGKSCWWDYEFNGNVTSVGTDTTTMDKEGKEPYYNTASNALWVGHATHYRGASYPEEFTAVLYGKMVNNEKHLEIGFGSTTGGTKVNVSIACGDPAKDEVKLLVSEGYTVKKEVLMSVPNAYTANHLYAFVYKTVVENSVEKSKVVVYLDGVEWDSFTFDGKVTLGGGFQIGSVHGGAPTGYAKATTANANAFLDFLRVYKTVLNPAAMAKYAAKYPYVSTNGRAARTFDAEVATWTAEDAWTVWPAEGASFTSNQPPARAMVAIDADVASTVTFDLDEDAAYEQLEIGGGNAITLKTGGTMKPTVSGLTTIDANVTNDWDAIGYGNVMVKEGKSLTFDFTNYPFTNCFASTTINLTGKPSGTGTFAAIIPEQYAGRTVEFRTNPDSGHYELVITVDTTQPFIYTIAEGGTGTWTWGTEQPVTEAVVDANASIPIQKNGTGTLEKALVNNRNYIVHEGTFKPTNANGITATVTVDTGATYDCNGKADGYITFALNGGTLVNNNGEIGAGSRQINGISLTQSSFLGGASNFGMVSGGYGANTLNLGGNTLTKNGDNTFFLCNTTVTNGMFDVTAGTIKVVNSAVTFKDDAVLQLGSGATLQVDAGRVLTIPALTAADATIDNAGTISGFTLSGSATLSGNGTYGTITNAVGAVADIGSRLGYFTFAGEGSAHAQLTDAWKPGDSVTLFSLAEGATTTVNTLKDKDGNVISPSRYSFKDGVVTFRKAGTMLFIR